jgi:hypothetical protein
MNRWNQKQITEKGQSVISQILSEEQTAKEQAGGQAGKYHSVIHAFKQFMNSFFSNAKLRKG